MYTNYDGIYIGHPSLDPILEELDRRMATVFVHPTNPLVSPELHNVSLPVIEYPFDTTRAITNLMFTRKHKKYPNIRWVWSHGGGSLPFVGARIAIQLTFPWAGSYDYDEAIQDLKGFYYDTAAVFTDAQLSGLVELVGVDQIVTGSDCMCIFFQTSIFLPTLTNLYQVHTPLTIWFQKPKQEWKTSPVSTMQQSKRLVGGTRSSSFHICMRNFPNSVASRHFDIGRLEFSRFCSELHLDVH